MEDEKATVKISWTSGGMAEEDLARAANTDAIEATASCLASVLDPLRAHRLYIFALVAYARGVVRLRGTPNLFFACVHALEAAIFVGPVELASGCDAGTKAQQGDQGGGGGELHRDFYVFGSVLVYGPKTRLAQVVI